MLAPIPTNASIVSITSSVAGVHTPLSIVHLRVAAPAPVIVILDASSLTLSTEKYQLIVFSNSDSLICLDIFAIFFVPILTAIILVVLGVSLVVLPLKLSFADLTAPVIQPTLHNGLINVTLLLAVFFANDS